jgi:hypothetical protein
MIPLVFFASCRGLLVLFLVCFEHLLVDLVLFVVKRVFDVVGHGRVLLLLLGVRVLIRLLGGTCIWWGQSNRQMEELPRN